MIWLQFDLYVVRNNAYFLGINAWWHLESRPVVRNQGMRYIPVCTGMYAVYTGTYVENGRYQYVSGMYQVCTGIMTCKIAMKCGTVFVFKHHHTPVPYTQYLFPLSKVKKYYPQMDFGELSTYWYVLVHTRYILECAGWTTCTVLGYQPVFVCLGTTIYSFNTPSFTYHSPNSPICVLSTFQQALYRPVHTGMYLWCTSTYSCSNCIAVHIHT